MRRRSRRSSGGWFARACDPVLPLLKTSGQYSAEQIQDWLLQTCFSGLSGPPAIAAAPAPATPARSPEKTTDRLGPGPAAVPGRAGRKGLPAAG